jgi:hypothetical protein
MEGLNIVFWLNDWINTGWAVCVHRWRQKAVFELLLGVGEGNENLATAECRN